MVVNGILFGVKTPLLAYPDVTQLIHGYVPSARRLTAESLGYQLNEGFSLTNSSQICGLNYLSIFLLIKRHMRKRLGLNIKVRLSLGFSKMLFLNNGSLCVKKCDNVVVYVEECWPLK